MTRRLAVLLSGRFIGNVDADGASVRFTYDEDYRRSRGATPLSLSMPLVSPGHDDAVGAYLWGLLPDNDRVLARWGREFQVSPRNPFALLTHVGEDCAGAVQFVAPDRVAAVVAGGAVEWLDDAEVAERLRALRRDPTAWRDTTHQGQFSLAGAQAKTALLRDGDAWGVPTGRTPTTHILKPAIAGLDDHDLNEHLCLRTSGLLGLASAHSEILEIGGERAVVVARYDRVRVRDGL